MKISIIMAFYNRQNLLDKTLESIRKSSVKDYELIIIDDASTVPLTCDEAKVIYVDKKDKWYTCSAVAFNRAMREATGDIIIIQNPECYHVGDVLKYAVDNIKDNTYLSFGCYAINRQETEAFHRGLMPIIYNHVVNSDGHGWYNHPTHRPVAYHFCSAIKRRDLDKIGGFDERYALGVSFDDDDFIRRIKGSGMNVKIITTPYVIHQYHTHFEMSSPSAWRIPHQKNKALFNMGYNPNTKVDYSRNTEFYPSDTPPWDVIKENYLKHYVDYDGDKTPRIPKKLYTMWLDGNVPQRNIELFDSWIANHPKWDFKIITKADLGYFKADSFIYQVLYKHGGVYIDPNFACAKPLDDLLYLDFFSGGRQADAKSPMPILSDKLIGCVPQNEFIRLAMEGREERNDKYLIDKYLSYIQSNTDKSVLFPDSFFYPMPGCIDAEISNYDSTAKIRIDTYIKPTTYCVYLWDIVKSPIPIVPHYVTDTRVHTPRRTNNAMSRRQRNRDRKEREEQDRKNRENNPQ